MIIDSHTHIEGRPDSPWLDPPETIIRLMNEAGIDKAVVMTYCDSPSHDENYEPVNYVAESVKKYPDRLIGYARLNPSYIQEAEALLLKALKIYNMKGLKLHPYGYRSPPDSKNTIQLIKKAAQFNAPTLFHCGDENFTLPLQIARAVKLCPQATIILGHMGGYFHVEDAINIAKEYKNVILETSAMPYPAMIKKAVDAIGAHRVLYASYGPGCDPKLEVYKVKLAELTENEENKIFYENISEILDKVKIFR